MSDEIQAVVADLCQVRGGHWFKLSRTKPVAFEHGQRFLDVHAAVYNLFNLGRHLVVTDHDAPAAQ